MNLVSEVHNIDNNNSNINNNELTAESDDEYSNYELIKANRKKRGILKTLRANNK